jgi:hypothetical protein
METMHAAGRRTLPPVPRITRERTGIERSSAAPRPTAAEVRAADAEVRAADAEVRPADAEVRPADAEGGPTDAVAEVGSPAPLSPARSRTGQDAAQQFVERLRSAAPDFAEAAGAESAVVREAVPPARHRRSRCRVVLRFADDTEDDVTFLGPSGAPGTPSRHGFDRQIRRWLGTGQPRDAAWLIPDPEASDGLAIDVTAWLATG